MRCKVRVCGQAAGDIIAAATTIATAKTARSSPRKNDPRVRTRMYYTFIDHSYNIHNYKGADFRCALPPASSELPGRKRRAQKRAEWWEAKPGMRLPAGSPCRSKRPASGAARGQALQHPTSRLCCGDALGGTFDRRRFMPTPGGDVAAFALPLRFAVAQTVPARAYDSIPTRCPCRAPSLSARSPASRSIPGGASSRSRAATPQARPMPQGRRSGHRHGGDSTKRANAPGTDCTRFAPPELPRSGSVLPKPAE